MKEKFKATYVKTFEAEREDAIMIAELKQPKDSICVNVEQIEDDEQQDDLFELLAGALNPNTEKVELLELIK